MWHERTRSTGGDEWISLSHVRIAGGMAWGLVFVLAACGLNMSGLAQDETLDAGGPDGSGPEGGHDTGATLGPPESGGTDATSSGEASVDAPADVSVEKDAAGCQSNSDCTGSPFDGTPTCSGGSCTSECGAAGNGTCGAGFCCQKGSCTAIADDACAPAGGTCVDCTTSSLAPTCLPTGTCGCSTNNDCQDGDYPVCLSNGTCGCNTSGDCASPNLCGNDFCQPPLSCGIGNPCSNGNCCAGDTCSDGCASCQLGFCVP
jgi:hypothetical protein